MSSKLDYDADRHCPIYKDVIGNGLCYETIMVMTQMLSIHSLPERERFQYPLEECKRLCSKCPYSDLS